MSPAPNPRLLLPWSIGLGWRAVLRDRARGATFLTTFAAVLIVQLLFVALLAARATHRFLAERENLRIEVLQNAPDADMQELYAALRALPFVGSVAYVPREKALEVERTRDPGLVEFLEKNGLRNPFPDIFAVALPDPGDIARLRSFLEQPSWQSVVAPSFFALAREEEARGREMIFTMRAARGVTMFLLLAALGALFCVLMERARRNARDAELLELLGAPRVFASAPEIAAQSLLAIVSLLLAAVLVGAFILLAPGAFPFAARWFPPVLRGELMRLLLLAGLPVLMLQILFAPVLAWGGAMMGRERR